MECFFTIITRLAIRRAAFTSVADLTATIEARIDGWDEHATSFTWTKPADELLTKIASAKARVSGPTHH